MDRKVDRRNFIAAAAAMGAAAETASAMPTASRDCAPAQSAVEVHGTVASGYERLREAFAAGQAGDPGGARLCVYRHGRVVADLWCGRDRVYNRPYSDTSLSVLFSATKGLVSTCLHMLVDRGLVDIDAPVARYWPEFAANGKDRITVASVLAHTAGLSWFTPDSGIQLMGLTDWQRCTAALAAMEPLWTPGAAYQYHSATHGHLVGEIVRRVSGKSIGRFFADEVAKPLGLNLWIGLPLSEEARVAPIFNSKHNEHPFMWFLNLRETLATEIPSANGVGDARSLARMYAALIGEIDGVRLWRREAVERALKPQTDGLDLVPFPSFLVGLYTPAFSQQLPPPLKQRFSLGYELPYASSPMLGTGSFGQPGMGGRIGFAHPASGTAVAYVCNNTTWNAYAGPDPRWKPWLAALGDALGIRVDATS